MRGSRARTGRRPPRARRGARDRRGPDRRSLRLRHRPPSHRAAVRRGGRAPPRAPDPRGAGRGAGHVHADAGGADGRPPAPQAGPPRPGPAAVLGRGQDGVGHRGRRVHRLRALPPLERMRAGAPRALRPSRERIVRAGDGVPRTLPRRASRARPRRRAPGGPAAQRLRRAPTRPRLPRGGLQARPDGGAERARGRAQQHHRHAQRGAGGRRPRDQGVRPRLDRQGGLPHQRHGSDQARRRDGGPGAAERRLRVRLRPVRQRPRLERERRAPLPRADRARRSGDRHRSQRDPLLHDRPRGFAAHPAGRRARRRR